MKEWFIFGIIQVQWEAIVRKKSVWKLNLYFTSENYIIRFADQGFNAI